MRPPPFLLLYISGICPYNDFMSKKRENRGRRLPGIFWIALCLVIGVGALAFPWRSLTSPSEEGEAPAPAATKTPAAYVTIALPATSTPEATEEPTPSPAPTPVPTEPPPDELIISCIGDCTLGGDPRIGQLDSFRAAWSENGERHFFSGAIRYTEGDDLTIVNLEGPLTAREAGADKEFAFRGDPEFARILASGSVEAVSLANNHAMDFGQEGYVDTLDALEAEGILAAGERHPAIHSVGKWTIGIAAGKFPGAERLAWLDEDVKALREAGCDIVIAVMHWGDEGAEAPKEELQNMAHSIVDMGVDLVVGHHPHILQGIEAYNGRLIAYSIGNFVFGGNRNPSERETAIFQQKFRMTDEGAVPGDFRILPYTVSSAPGNDYRPAELEGDAAQRVFDAINRRGALLPTHVPISEGWQPLPQ